MTGTRKYVVMGLGLQVAALILLACLRSDKLVSYTYDLPPNAITDKIAAGAEAWDGLMQSAGVADARDSFITGLDEIRQSPESF